MDQAQQTTFSSMADLVAPVIDKLQGWAEGALAMLPNLVLALLVVGAFWFLARLAGRGTREGLRRVSDNEQLNGLASVLARLGVLAAGVFLALSVMQLDKAVTSLLAGVGVVGLALGFAFQDIAANFMSGILMAVRRPFKVGDRIETNDYVGIVEHIDLRATHLRQPTGERVIIPNRLVFSSPMENFETTGARRVDLECGVSYADDLEEVETLTLEAVDDVPGRSDREAEVFFTSFGGSSIDLVVRFWLDGTSQARYLAARSAAIKALKKAYDEAGVSIPFPIRTLDFGIEGGESLRSHVEVLQGREQAAAAK